MTQEQINEYSIVMAEFNCYGTIKCLYVRI